MTPKIAIRNFRVEDEPESRFEITHFVRFDDIGGNPNLFRSELVKFSQRKVKEFRI
jgi:hypothetical protein